MGKIYKGAHTGEFVVVSCRVGLRMVKGLSTAGMMGCCNTGCACGADDVRFVKANPEQVEGFWRSSNSYASEAMETAESGW